MPKVSEIKKTMKKQLPAELFARIDFPKAQRNLPEEVLYLIGQMDRLLTREQCLAIMEEQGCCKDEKTIAPFRAFGEKYADKTVAERLALFDELETGHKAPCRLNPDGTLSIYWDGWDPVNKRCVCRLIKCLYKDRGGPVNVSDTFCGCCAGHARNTHQYALGVRLRLKEIVSSPVSSNGKERCEFNFEII
ncbi:MAG: hypothetical protein FWE80_10250 [Oscillospiraceae bacterium]|nr:hypothetical protein [Oscillospiraceae bacterium]